MANDGVKQAALGKASSHTLTLSVDYGTTKIRAAYCLAGHKATPNPATVKLLLLQRQRALIPSEVGFVRLPGRQHFDFLWGQELRAAVEKDKLRGDNVFLFHGLKMCLYPTEVQGNHREILQTQLDQYVEVAGPAKKLTPEDLIRMHLKAIRESTIAAVVEKYKGIWPEEEVKAMPQRWSFTVPEIATLATNQQFSQLIRDAGYPKGIMLMAETEAAAARLLYEHAKGQQDLPEQLQEKDIVVVVDAGGLTVNVSAYQIFGRVDVGAAVQFSLVNKDGLACGSETLVKRLLQHIKQQAEAQPHKYSQGFQDVLDQISMTEAQVERDLSAEFEPYKSSQGKKTLNLTLEGRHKTTGEDGEASFRISRDAVQGWLRNISNEIISKVRHTLKAIKKEGVRGDEVEVMLMPTGGLMRNDFILDAIRKAFEGRGATIQTNATGQVDIGPSDPSVVMGACMRTVSCDPIFSDTFSLGILRDEPYMEGTHGNDVDLLDTVEGDYVEDCWCTLVPFNAVAKCHKARNTWTQYCRYFVDPAHPVISERVYASDHHIPDHTVSAHRHRPVAGLQLYREVEEPIDLARLKKYPTIMLGGKTLHIVPTKLIASMELTQLELKLELIDPKFDEEKDKDDSHLAASTALGSDSMVLHEAEYPSSLQRNPIQGRKGLKRAAPQSPAKSSAGLAGRIDEGVAFLNIDGDAEESAPKKRRRNAALELADTDYNPGEMSGPFPSVGRATARPRRKAGEKKM